MFVEQPQFVHFIALLRSTPSACSERIMTRPSRAPAQHLRNSVAVTHSRPPLGTCLEQEAGAGAETFGGRHGCSERDPRRGDRLLVRFQADQWRRAGPGQKLAWLFFSLHHSAHRRFTYLLVVQCQQAFDHGGRFRLVLAMLRIEAIFRKIWVSLLSTAEVAVGLGARGRNRTGAR